MRLLAQAELGQVDRILLGCGDESDQCWENDGIGTLLVARGYSTERSGTTAALFHRDGAQTP